MKNYLNDENEVHFMPELKRYPPIEATEVKQDKYKFYIFRMNSDDLLRIAYTSPRNKNRKRGIQRGLDKNRL